MQGYSALLLLTLEAFSFTARVNADCYSHDGIAALKSQWYTGPELVSCGNGTNNCCLVNQQCGSNLLCKDAENGISRQYCADNNWDECSMLCPDFTGAGVVLTNCGRNLYCCPGASDNCCSDGSAFFVDPLSGDVKDASSVTIFSTATASWWRVDSTALLAAASTSSTSPSTSLPSSAAGTTSALLSSAQQSTATSSGSSGQSAAATSTSSSSTRPSTEGPSPRGLSAGAGAGIGVGAAVAVAGIAALLWSLFRERKKRRELEAQVAPQGQAQTSHGQMQVAPQSQGQQYEGNVVEYYGGSGPKETYRYEAPGVGRERSELEGDGGRRVEIG